jgi:hypothetical protein
MSATTSAGSCETTSGTADETTSDDKCNDNFSATDFCVSGGLTI